MHFYKFVNRKHRKNKEKTRKKFKTQKNKKTTKEIESKNEQILQTRRCFFGNIYKSAIT